MCYSVNDELSMEKQINTARMMAVKLDKWRD